ncbi:MAG: hypothetical protein ACREDR_40360, partial [Blastocatellia bacterium]
GTIEELGGRVPTKEEALSLLKKAGATDIRIEGAHAAPNPHSYSHINFQLGSGARGTIRFGGGS